ncbi:MarR family transcriptional regulator [Amycolatopsis acidiphila]|uniref:MarR family transcriptional regulator n=1 Tax=Amycolatopsis acidiphila TaxID=715473 RepID=A0A557ZPI5_9PSEU|nr:MarR family transcriptional regulator [Amycolatopsis acidiphila]TVT13945.1 MarR family transcriptional regulator [Amycolatopsis acidiphila]UIJ61085.1 MarR family transcriptional regulator [Amycolatopsis acidiphila]GHG86854.1 MarR family transcriptional regulator [Amycolatopsis acidiphila]
MPHGDLPGLLALTFRAVMDQIHEHLAAEGFDDVRPAHGFAFQYLSHSGGATAVELAEHLGVTKQAAVQLIDELEKRGYVERRPHPTDRRARMVGLTQRGWQCIERVVAWSVDAEARWAGLIGAGQLDQLRNGLIEFVRDAARERPVKLRPVW